MTRDVWIYDTAAKKYTQLSTFNGEDRNPVFDSNDNDFYYLSEQSGTFNVYKSSLPIPRRSTPVTKFTKNPVRFLTRAKNGTLCFGYDGELYTMKPGGEPAKVNVRIGADGRRRDREDRPGQRRIHRGEASPNGKEFAFIFRGEIFVSEHRRQDRQAHHQHAVAGTQRELQPGRPVARLCRREGQQLEHVYDVDHAQGGAVLLRLDSVERRSRWSRRRRRISARIFPGRQRGRLPRESPDAQGDQPRHEAIAHGPARPTRTTRTPMAISITRGRRTANGCWCSSATANGSSRRGRARRGRRQGRGSQPDPERIRRRRRRNGRWTAR